MILFRSLLICFCLFNSLSSAIAQSPQDKKPPAPLDLATQEAMLAYSRGLIGLKTGNYEQAVQSFHRAVRLKPLRGQFRYMLATAYGRNGDPGNQWIQLRQAVRLAPDNDKAMQEFLTMWNMAVSKGVFDVGTPADTIKERIGKPDDIHEQGGNTFWQYGLMGLQFIDAKLYAIIDISIMTNTAPIRPASPVAVDLSFRDLDWRLKTRHLSSSGNRLEYIPSASNNQPPLELFTIERRLDLPADSTAEQLVQTMQAELKQRLNIEIQVISADENDVLYQWAISDQQQHEIGRILSNGSDTHYLTYRARGEAINDEKLALWQETLKATKLVAAAQQ